MVIHFPTALEYSDTAEAKHLTKSSVFDFPMKTGSGCYSVHVVAMDFAVVTVHIVSSSFLSNQTVEAAATVKFIAHRCQHKIKESHRIDRWQVAQ